MSKGGKLSNKNIKIRTQKNITTSLFHYTSLNHLKSVPFYRISTPKAPFFIEKGGPDDRYIIPIDNYKTMNIILYSELLNINSDDLKDCGVFFVDEFTSMIYSVVENDIDDHIF